MVSKIDVLNYLKGRKKCDGRCIYHTFCPEFPPPNTGVDIPCSILQVGTIDTFYNVFFAESDGIKNELQRTLYKMQGESEPQEYLTACIKTYSTVYKDDTDVAPPEINISIEPVDSECIYAKDRNETPQKPATKSCKSKK